MEGKIRGKIYLVLLTLITAALWLADCSISEDNGGKVRDLDFTVVGDIDIPGGLKKLIMEKQQQPSKLTYNDEQNPYIAVGCGVQPTGGYSIGVSDLYLTDNSIIINAELKGPEKGENIGTEQSLPFIVIKTEYLENPVVFQ